MSAVHVLAREPNQEPKIVYRYKKYGDTGLDGKGKDRYTFRDKKQYYYTHNTKLTIDGNSKTIYFRSNIVLKNGIRFKITDKGIFANNQLLAQGNRHRRTGA